MADEERTEEAAPEVAPPEQPRVTIDLDEEADDAEEKGQAPAPGQGQGERQQRRQIRKQRDDFQRQVVQLQTEMAELRGRLSVPQAAPPSGQASGADPIETEIKSIGLQQKAVIRAIQAPGLSGAEVEELESTWRQMENHRRKLEYRQFRAQERQTEAPAGEGGDVQFVRMTLEAEYPQIWANKAMKMRAQAEMQELMERGKPEGLATAREACQRVADRHGIGRKAPAPTDLERSRHSSIPSRAGAAGNGSGNQYTPSKFELNLAKGFTKHLPDLSDEDRVRKWMAATGSGRQRAG